MKIYFNKMLSYRRETALKLCSRLSSSEVRFCTELGRLAFLRPLWGT